MRCSTYPVAPLCRTIGVDDPLSSTLRDGGYEDRVKGFQSMSLKKSAAADLRPSIALPQALGRTDRFAAGPLRGPNRFTNGTLGPLGRGVGDPSRQTLAGHAPLPRATTNPT